jgi:ABC-type branched-subunit amino acid transport system permease subunit
MQSIVESSRTRDTFTLLIFIAVVLTAPIWGEFIGAGYPDLLQKFAIFGLFAIGYNILFGLTGYLSFGHAAFLGVGSYATVWSFKLLSMNAIPAVIFAVALSAIFAVVIGYLSLRRSHRCHTTWLTQYSRLSPMVRLACS